MPVELVVPAPAKILVVAPHMDDEVIPCGGTAILNADAGGAVGVVFVSDSGGVGDGQARERRAANRHEEARRVTESLGFEVVASLGFPDTKLPLYEGHITAGLTEIIASFSPERVFCPFPSDSHADHQATAIAVAAACRAAALKGEVWAYELWTPIWPNRLVDISSVVTRKEEAIGLYASQMADRNYAAAILGLNRYRGMPFRRDYAEGFYVCSAAEFSSLAHKLHLR